MKASNINISFKINKQTKYSLVSNITTSGINYVLTRLKCLRYWVHKASESADMLITIIFKQNEPRSIQSLIWLVRRSQLCETISLIPDVKTSVFIFLPSHVLVMPFKCLATWYRTLGCWLARLTLLEGGAYWTARITGRNWLSDASSLKKT